MVNRQVKINELSADMNKEKVIQSCIQIVKDGGINEIYML